MDLCGEQRDDNRLVENKVCVCVHVAYTSVVFFVSVWVLRLRIKQACAPS